MRSTDIPPLVVAAFAISASLPFSTGASAQTVTKEDAWRKCLQYIDKMLPRTGENDQDRTAQFKTCMAKMKVRP